ncbi:tetratricopeptide repeat protein [Halovivax ruber XH-70]|uniref:Tetratricopeptide repeat protein n=1 Tax=Halovivax ruber (strain DSM 18193 / JCM 13892 / XH-70) TaxID=797302 RepID=L0IG98_HALRX|nr:BREX system ATP-binding domain-containing protein [Halovivax ruber]AGB17007.1 tetratricopeptide repeat protein [Halovivax ruber XH-70]
MDHSLADLVCLYLAADPASEHDGSRAETESPAAPVDIATGIGIDPADISSRLGVFEALTGLVTDGFLTETVQRTAAGYERTVYELTDSGRARARDVRRTLDSPPDTDREEYQPAAGIDWQENDVYSPPRPVEPNDGGEPDETRFVGREAELEFLYSALSSIHRRGGRTLFVTGDRGVGKSTLCARVIEQARERDVAVGRARCSRDADEPYGPLRRAIDRAFDEPVPDALIDPPAATLDDGASIAARRSGLLGHVADAVCDRVIDRPTLLVVDDLHNAGASTLALFERIATASAAWVYPLMLVGVYRPRAVGDAAPLAAMRARLSTDVRIDDQVVEPFERAETARLVRLARGPDVSTQLVDRIHETAGGNPLFVAETLAGLAESGATTDPTAAADSAGPATSLELPAAPERAIERRLEPLDDAGWAVIEAAAILGHRIEPDVLRSIVSLPESDVSAYVRLLVDARFLDRTDDGETLTFPSEVVRETVVDSTAPDRRRELHGRAADALVDTDAPPATIAHHCAEADASSRAIEYFERAAQRAHRRYAGSNAIELYERALDLATQIDETRRVADLQLALGETRFVRGEYELAAEHFVAARDGATDATNSARAHHRLAEILVKRGDVDRGIETATAGLGAVTDDVPAADRCRLHRVLGWGLIQRGELADARDAFEQQAAVAADAADDSLLALADHDRGTLAGMTGEIECAEAKLAAAAAAFDRLDDPNLRAKSLTNLALVYRRSGRLDDALAANDRALAIQREYGYLETLPDSLLNQAELQYARGDLALATDSYEAAIDAAMDSGRDERAAKARTNLSQVLTERGRLGLAFRRCQAAIDAFDRLGASDGLVLAYTARAAINRCAGEFENARADAERALSLARDLGNDDRVAAARNALGLVARSTGEVTDALAHHEAAASLSADGGADVAAMTYRLEAIADRLADPERDSADELASLARTVVDEADERVLAARASTRYGRACRRCGAFEAAQRALDEACEAQEALGAVVDRCETLLARCALELDTDRPGEAANSLSVANGVIQEYGLAMYSERVDQLHRRLE